MKKSDILNCVKDKRNSLTRAGALRGGALVC